MSKENHFVAEVYNRLWPWIVHDGTLKFCLDDGGQGGCSTPDLCFHFDGKLNCMRIECKIIYSKNKAKSKKKNHLKAYRKQLLTWANVSAESPCIWIAKGEDADQYYIWRHDHADFLKAFKAAAQTVKQNNGKSQFVPVPGSALNNPLTFAGLFHHIWIAAIAAGALKV